MKKIWMLINIVCMLFPMIVEAGQEMNVAASDYNLSVSFDIPNSKLSGVASLTVKAGDEISLDIGSLEILDARVNGQKIALLSSTPGSLKVSSLSDGLLEIRYSGVYKDRHSVDKTNYGVTGDSIDSRGISLTGLWYPKMDGLQKYNLKAELPNGFEAVSEADRIVKKSKDGMTEFTFEFAHPVESITFVASSGYEIVKESYKGIELYAYFFKEDIGLAGTYIEYARKYLDMYEKILDRYSFKRFSIVENFLPTGYSMPTYTLLGRDIVKLPFIVETSLGHEILHQWFGNSVYVDYDRGNWSEGLTAYMADHYYEEQKGRGADYRKETLLNYKSYVNEKNEFPLKDFRTRTDFSSRAIGYGKTAMVFHMLKKLVGDEVFHKSLLSFVETRRFQKASWDDLKKEFENASKKDLSLFFKQWIDGKGVPVITAENPRLRLVGGKSEVTFDLLQKSGVYSMDLPVSFYYPNGDKTTDSVKIEKEKNNVKMLLDDVPEYIVLDEDYDVLRGLTDSEFTPVIARLFGDEKPLIALPPAGKEIYKSVTDYFKDKGSAEKEANDTKEPEIKDSTVVVLGKDNPLISRLFGKLEVPDAGFSITVKNNPWNSGKVVAVINSKSARETEAAFGKLFHYGKYSSLSFTGGKNVSKATEKSRRGIRMDLNKKADVVDISTVRSVTDVINGVSEKKIVYVGETHDMFAHHNVQLQIMKGLFRKNKKIAIGMEMFQKPYQKIIDDYIAGNIDEKQFLKGTEYFKRWGFDYNLYKPIMDFAKSEKLPVIALNIKREIVEKVSKDGIGSLTDEERKELPGEMDFSDSEYRERLKDIFDKHKNSGNRNFDYFFQSQVLWDETMSQSVDEFLKKNPDYQKEGRIIVLAGGGHLAYGSGIPKRTFRRNGLDYSIVLNDDDIEKDIADYVVMPKNLEGAVAPKLMAIIREDNGKLRFEGFAEDSVSEKAGIRTGDTIVSLDGVAVTDLSDAKIHLFYKKKGDTLRVRVVRKRFLFGDKEMDFDVVL